MRKRFITQTATTLLISITALAGCKKGDPAIMSEVTMTTAKEGKCYIYIAGNGEATIDWGDGTTPETVTLSGYKGRLTHIFSDTTSRTIVINGQSIRHLVCSLMQLTALDVTKCTALKVLYCDYNLLTSLDITNNTALTELYCHENELTALDVSKNTALEVLHCYGNGLTSLDVTNNTALKDMDCYWNGITSLDVSNNTALTELTCHHNRLTSLDVTNNTALTELWCEFNQLTAESLNSLFGTLHANAVTGFKVISIFGNPGTDACDRSIAEAKEWRVN